MTGQEVPREITARLTADALINRALNRLFGSAL